MISDLIQQEDSCLGQELQSQDDVCFVSIIKEALREAHRQIKLTETANLQRRDQAPSRHEVHRLGRRVFDVLAICGEQLLSVEGSPSPMSRPNIRKGRDRPE